MAEAGPPNRSMPVQNDALEDLVRQYLPVVYSAARRQLSDPSLAEDVTQAVFMVLARRRAGLSVNVVLSSWLLKVTHFACLQARRDAGRRTKHERRAAQMRPATVPSELMTKGQLASELDAVLARLGGADRSVLTLRYLEQRSVTEVAQHLGISEEAAQKRIGRAMTRVREKLGVSEEQLGASALGAFFLTQNRIMVPAHLATQVGHAVAMAGTAGASTTAAGVISKGVLKALFWSSVKMPMALAGIAVVVSASAFFVERTISHEKEIPPVAHVPKVGASSFDTFTAASSDLPGAGYPRLNRAGRATFRIYAPDARAVAVQIGDTYLMDKGDDGYWTVTTSSLAPGFHYYNLLIDGAAVLDPGSSAFLGSSKMLSGLEVPEETEDFFLERDVPHGEIRARYYYSALTNSTRQAYVYTPPSYESQVVSRYPVLYLLPGMGEDESAWVEQGHVAAILDNLIAEGKTREMIVVAEDAGTAAGYAARGTGRGARGGSLGGDFTRVFISETIPTIDAAYRTIPDREHRALAGTSLGATQVMQISQNHLDMFAYVGLFSAPFGYPTMADGYGGLLEHPDEFARQIKLLYISDAVNENNTAAQMFHDQLETAGVSHIFFQASGNFHGWQTWRKSLHGMAPLLFQK